MISIVTKKSVRVNLLLICLLIYTCLVTNTYAKDEMLFILRNEEKVPIDDILVIKEPITIYYEPSDKTGRVECKINNEIVGISYSKPAEFNITLDMMDLLYNQIRFVSYDRSNNIISKSSYTLKMNLDRQYTDRASRKKIANNGVEMTQYNVDYIPILMYHDIVPSKQVKNDSSQVSTALFEKQLKALLSEGYRTINFYDYYQYMNGKQQLPEKTIIVTFDDGYLSNYTYAYPILSKLELQATYFVATANIGKRLYSKDHFTWENALEMEKSGLIDIQSHTHTHCDMSEASEKEQLEEVVNSFDLIEKHLGKRDIRVICYPEFKNSWSARKVANDYNVQLQITDLARKDYLSNYPNELRRIHVHNTLSPKELIAEIENLTAK